MSDDVDETEKSDYVLVKLQSTPLVSYLDAQDTKYTHDFDVTLIVSWIDQNAPSDSQEITLKYYLILTSKRELYPKREVENNKLGKFRTVHSIAKSLGSSTQLESPSDTSPASTTSPIYVKSSKHQDQILASSSGMHEEISEHSVEGFLQEFDKLEDENESPIPTPSPVPESPLAQNALNTSSSSSNLAAQIKPEPVNYMGYYSSHEQLMQQLMMKQSAAAQEHIVDMVEKGALHCRTHLLWNKLLESRSHMTYMEFTELFSLAQVESLSSIDPRLGPLLNQPINWYKGLAQVLQNKYQEHHKQFNTPDGNMVYHLVLHSNYVKAFMMLTIDVQTSKGVSFQILLKNCCKSEHFVKFPFILIILILHLFYTFFF